MTPLPMRGARSQFGRMIRGGDLWGSDAYAGQDMRLEGVGPGALPDSFGASATAASVAGPANGWVGSIQGGAGDSYGAAAPGSISPLMGGPASLSGPRGDISRGAEIEGPAGAAMGDPYAANPAPSPFNPTPQPYNPMSTFGGGGGGGGGYDAMATFGARPQQAMPMQPNSFGPRQPQPPAQQGSGDSYGAAPSMQGPSRYGQAMRGGMPRLPRGGGSPSGGMGAMSSGGPGGWGAPASGQRSPGMSASPLSEPSGTPGGMMRGPKQRPGRTMGGGASFGSGGGLGGGRF